MKKIILFVAVLFVAHISFGQIFSFGLKGGVNSSKISFSDFSVDKAPSVSINPDYYTEIAGHLTSGMSDADIALALANPNYYSVNAPKVSFEPSSYEMGFHFGAFARFKILGIFLQPELIFSQTNAAINLSPDGFDASQVANDVLTTKIKYNNFDVPIMLGIKLGPAHLCAGPVATFKLSSSVDDATKKLLEDIESENDIDVFTVTKNATFGAQVGAGLTLLKKVTLDVRYEFGLSKLGDSVNIGDHEFKTDQRQNQFLASIGWMF